MSRLKALKQMGVDLASICNVESQISQVTSHDVCAGCGGQLHKIISGLEYICESCGYVLEGDTSIVTSDDTPATQTCGRIRIVGANSGYLQSGLYRDCGGITAEMQKKQLYEELMNYQAEYTQKDHGRSIPYNICKRTAELYNKVQQSHVKRSQNKRSIMAALLRQACLESEISIQIPEIAKFMKLPSLGISRGQNFIHTMVSAGEMDVDIHIDPRKAEANSMMAYLELDGEKYLPIKEATLQIVDVAVKLNIGTSSNMRSKVAGALFEVLNRSKLIKQKITIQEFCKSCSGIRKNTVERFTTELKKYHSKFISVYEENQLDSRKA